MKDFYAFASIAAFCGIVGVTIAGLSMSDVSTVKQPAPTATTPTRWLNDDCHSELSISPAEFYEYEINYENNFHYKFIDQGDVVEIERRDPDGRGVTTDNFYRTEAACHAAAEAAKQNHEQWLNKYR